jgi:hypothetical protein
MYQEQQEHKPDLPTQQIVQKPQQQQQQQQEMPKLVVPDQQ